MLIINPKNLYKKALTAILCYLHLDIKEGEKHSKKSFEYLPINILKKQNIVQLKIKLSHKIFNKSENLLVKTKKRQC